MLYLQGTILDIAPIGLIHLFDFVCFCISYPNLPLYLSPSVAFYFVVFFCTSVDVFLLYLFIIFGK